MIISRNRTKAATMAFILMLTIATTLLTCLPTVRAHTPPWTVPTWAFISVTPNPVGVGQNVLIVMWLNMYPPTASGNFGDRWDGFTVEITKPDGITKQTLGPFTSDPVGSYYTHYAPDAVGKYTFVFKFPGDTVTGVPFPPDWSPASFGYETIGDVYQASTSDPVILTVQQEPIQGYQETPPPEGYWTRPIYGANREWSTVAGNWLGGAAQNVGPTTNFGYGKGPESAHVMWTRPYWAGGIMDTRFSDVGYYSGLSYEELWGSAIILNGKLYYDVRTPPRYGWYCVDLRTGHEDYFHNTTGPVTDLYTGYFDSSGAIIGGALAFGQIYDYESPNQHGGFPYLWSTGPAPRFDVSPENTWRMFDAFTGNYICSINNVPFWVTGAAPYIMPTGVNVYGKEGSILYYNIAGTTDPANPFAPPMPPFYLQVWNTSRAIWYEPFFPSNSYWFWRPNLNATFDGNNGYSLNVSIPNVQGSILAVREGQYVLGGTSGKHNSTYTQLGNLWALNLDPKKGAIGSLLWNKTYTPPETVVPDVSTGGLFGGGSMIGPIVDPEDGFFVFKEEMTRRWWGFSLDTMQMLWGPTKSEGSWNFYGMSYNFYKGKLLSTGISGELIAYDLKTGKALWNWTSGSVGFENFYGGNAPLEFGCIADEKVYLYSSEHSPSQPLRRDAFVWCVDVETGKLLWKIQCWANGLSVADGYIVTLDNFDNQIYCYGKGPSATTVSAKPGVVANGSSVIIEGTVTDQSAGAKGTPAISDADQEAWMEYLYQQRAMPTNAKGVPVLLQAMRSDGSVIDITTVTSDIMGHFEYKWTPPTTDTYKILATFLGSKSYSMSSAETALGVDPAPPAPTPAPTKDEVANQVVAQLPTFTTTDLVIIVGVIVAIVIGIVSLLDHRRLRK